MLVFIIELVRQRKLKEEYSVLWVLTALVLLVLAVWLDLLQWITDAVGGVALSSTLFLFALLFVFFMLLHFSLRISKFERTLTALVQEIGLQNARRRPLGGGAPREDEEVDGGAVAARIAVIVPCFNDGEYAAQAVASVRRGRSRSRSWSSTTVRPSGRRSTRCAGSRPTASALSTGRTPASAQPG